MQWWPPEYDTSATTSSFPAQQSHWWSHGYHIQFCQSYSIARGTSWEDDRSIWAAGWKASVQPWQTAGRSCWSLQQQERWLHL